MRGCTFSLSSSCEGIETNWDCFSVGSDRSISMPIGQSVRDRMIFYFVHRTQKKELLSLILD